ncbi:MAG: PQQ-binding-like beta-propeller repeat protein [Rubripirellula sp.]
MRTLLMLLCFVATTVVAVAESNWPEFRGPTGDGHTDADLPAKIDEGVVRWKTPIHGKGWSSPVVWGDKIWLTTATEDGKQMSVICVDRRSGKLLHDKVLIENEEPAFCHAMNSYATPTPVVEEGRVYIHFGSYLTACLDTNTADVIWQRQDLECDHFRGPASSPILHNGKLYVAYDGFDVQYVVALDKTSGKTLWKRDREIDYGTDNGDRMKAYCTAEVIEVAGKEQLVYPSASATIVYDPENGKSLWTVYHDGMNASARPLFSQGLVFITNGSGGMVAVRADGKGDVTGSHIAWSDKRGVPKKSSPIIVDGLLYTNSDDGIISCREPATGDVIWQKRVGGEFAASPIFSGKHIYMFSIEGTILILKPGPEFDLVSESNLGDGFMASPAVVNNDLILRSKSHLYCIRGK